MQFINPGHFTIWRICFYIRVEGYPGCSKTHISDEHFVSSLFWDPDSKVFVLVWALGRLLLPVWKSRELACTSHILDMWKIILPIWYIVQWCHNAKEAGQCKTQRKRKFLCFFWMTCYDHPDHMSSAFCTLLMPSRHTIGSPLHPRPRLWSVRCQQCPAHQVAGGMHGMWTVSAPLALWQLEDGAAHLWIQFSIDWHQFPICNW